MNLAELEQAIEKMTDEEKAVLLAAEIPDELEKEAAAEVAQSDFENALVAYGMLTADLEIESEEAGEEGLSKEASAEFDAAEKEISEAIEQGVIELGLDQIEDAQELHKTAMAAAALVFEGYAAQIEKEAAAGKKIKGLLKNTQKHMGAMAAKAKDMAGKGMAAAKKHKNVGMAAAAGAAAGYGAKKLMDKKASEMTAQELVEATLEQSETIDLIVDGVEKLAAKGAAKGALLAKGMGKVKALGKSLKAQGKKHGKHMAGAGAAAGLAGVIAGRMSKKDKK